MSEIAEVRRLQRLVPAQATADGAGVRLYRSLGSAPALRWDPFLMLDEFASEDPREYLGGFPAHPHRGFETVTYMLDGRMRHEDSLGNRGDLGPGDVQWMSAARGVIHSEMPQQQEGRMRGFQLWINLPARDKMRPAWYRDVPAAQIPVADLEGGGTAHVIRGSVRQGALSTEGPVRIESAASLYLDIHLAPGAACSVPVAAEHNGLVYVYEGDLALGAEGAPVPRRHAGLLCPGGAVQARAGAAGARFLLLTGTPLGEPIVQLGPFVMNTRAQIERAVADYHSGELGRA